MAGNTIAPRASMAASSPGANRHPRKVAPATSQLRSCDPRSPRSTDVTRQPFIERAPAASRRSSSASEATSTTRPLVRLTGTTLERVGQQLPEQVVLVDLEATRAEPRAHVGAVTQ